MVAKARVLSNLTALRVLLLTGRTEDALALIEGFRARLEGDSDGPPDAHTRPPLRVIAGGRDAS